MPQILAEKFFPDHRLLTTSSMTFCDICEKPNAAFAHISSTQPLLEGIGIIGIDHKEVSANVFNDVINLDSHNFVYHTAVQTKNRVTAIQITEIISFHKSIANHQTSNLISHHNISCFAASIPFKFNPDIISTKTVDMLIAKQIIAGAKIIGSNFLIVK